MVLTSKSLEDFPLTCHRMAVTTAIDPAQYAWLALDVDSTSYIYFRLNLLTSNMSGTVWREFLPLPSRSYSTPEVMDSWDYVSIVDQSPKTVEIDCHPLTPKSETK